MSSSCRGRRRRRSRTALLAGSALIASGALVACTSEGPPTSYALGIELSAFSRSVMTVPAGRRITVELRNDDPIDHEWIVGADEVHTRHRAGAEPAHATAPTEVTVPAQSRRITTFVFEARGDYSYICHLPGHEAYGMVGVLRVV